MRNQSGFSLVDVMMAGVILVLGLAGSAALILTSLAQTGEARDLTLARFQAQSLSERLQLSPSDTRSYLAGTACADAAACASGAIATQLVSDWQSGLADRLPGASGLLCRDSTPNDGGPEAPDCDGRGLAVVKLFWITSDPDQPRRHVELVPL